LPRIRWSMSRICQDDVGQCDFIDVLEEAVLRRRPVAVQLRAGETFIDQMMDVVTEAGQEFAVFRSHARVPVKEIAAVSRSESRSMS
jgi:transcriptional antiterminator Rof (Rho-off)